MLTAKRMALLRDVRLAAGLKQAQVAAQIRRADGSDKVIDDTLLSRLERCEVALPDGFAWIYLEAVVEAKRAT